MSSFFRGLLGSPSKPPQQQQQDDDDDSSHEAPTTQQEESSAVTPTTQETDTIIETQQDEEEENQFETQMVEETTTTAVYEEEVMTTETTTVEATKNPEEEKNEEKDENSEDEEENEPRTQMETQVEETPIAPPPSVNRTTTQENTTRLSSPVAPQRQEPEQVIPMQHQAPREQVSSPRQEGPPADQLADKTSRTVSFPPMPLRNGIRKESFQRYRSLSKVFTKLPDKIPDVNTMMMDMLEYTCQIILMETSLDKLQTLQVRLEQLLPHCVPFIHTGRLNSRLQLVALALDLAHSKDWRSADWHNAIVQFQYVKSRMLLSTANDPPGNVTAELRRNTELSQHPSMTNEYKESLDNLRFQMAIATFHEHLSVSDSVRNIENAIDEYRRSLQIIYGSPVPKHLEEFIKADVYSPRRTANASNAERLLYHCKQLHDPNVAHGILLRWAEVILDPPALIQIGYGGVTGVCMPLYASHQNDDDDVSSIGEEDEEIPQQNTAGLSAEDRDAVEQLARVSRRSSEPTAEDTMMEEPTAADTRTYSTVDGRKEYPTETRKGPPADTTRESPVVTRKEPPVDVTTREQLQTQDEATPRSKRPAEMSIWPDTSSDEEELFERARGGKRNSKSLFRLYAMVKKRKLGHEIYDSAKENSDPRPAESSQLLPGSTQPTNESSRQTASNHDEQVDKTTPAKAPPVINLLFDDSSSSEDDRMARTPTAATTPLRTSRRTTPDDNDDEESSSSDNVQDEDNEEESSDDEPLRSRASSAPGRAVRLTYQSPRANIAKPRSLMTDSPLRRYPPARKQRVPFTDDENEAILEGIDKYGHKWSLIQKSDPRLKNRTQTDIRCRFRTMLKQQIV